MSDRRLALLRALSTTPTLTTTYLEVLSGRRTLDALVQFMMYRGPLS